VVSVSLLAISLLIRKRHWSTVIRHLLKGNQSPIASSIDQ